MTTLSAFMTLRAPAELAAAIDDLVTRTGLSRHAILGVLVRRGIASMTPEDVLAEMPADGRRGRRAQTA